MEERWSVSPADSFLVRAVDDTSLLSLFFPIERETRVALAEFLADGADRSINCEKRKYRDDA